MIWIKVPATSANLGPGYDCAGAALSLYSRFGFEPADALRIEGCPAAYQNEDNLVIQAFKKTLEAAGKPYVPVHLVTESHIPFSRGLGSSSSCIVAGAVAANALTGNTLSEETLLNICTELEGHPDNVAPCLYGGVVSGFTEAGRTHVVRLSVHSRWRFVTLIPDYEVSTAMARKAVKQDIDVKTSVYTTGHVIAFLHALEKGDTALAAESCHDVLHEPYRRKLIPDYDRARAAAFENGATAFFISGSGSTMIALCDAEEKGVSARELAASDAPNPTAVPTEEKSAPARVLAAFRQAFPAFEAMELHVSADGAVIEPDTVV